MTRLGAEAAYWPSKPSGCASLALVLSRRTSRPITSPTIAMAQMSVAGIAATMITGAMSLAGIRSRGLKQAFSVALPSRNASNGRIQSRSRGAGRAGRRGLPESLRAPYDGRLSAEGFC